MKISFAAHGREFLLKLTRDTSLFHPDYTVVSSSGESLDHLDHTHYHGKVEGRVTTNHQA